MSDKPEEAEPKKKGGGKMKIIVMVVVLLVLVGGGVGAGVFAASSGLIGGGHAAAEEDHGPKLVPKSEQKRPKAEGEGGEGGHGGGESGGSHDSGGGKHVPSGGPGDRYASNYYTMEPSFTSNLQNSVHVVQIGLAISTPYDDTVIENLKTNDIAVRSAVLLTLGDTPEDQVFSSEGKEQLQKRLAKAINDTLTQKEGFGGVSNVYFTNFVVQ
ncbi:flagellar basal body protein FliL [Arthrobacter sp. TPD3018]|uniref:flagellar basal body-associated FliL family protein n=1 Tax=Bacteria TaxID=2 RepID=UPI000D50D069|nr:MULTISPECIES: flagellar basal body-associated FliL family protein [Bacteria]PVE59254.1 flagellar basal body protein FliL [Sphingomonas sp. TPD3009]PVE60775.1 flagellar basal body protein FliL [Arthrobacter sp. TPD3018]PVE87453.1 flagellar basal body protein FliL [Sphingomonas melonis]